MIVLDIFPLKSGAEVEMEDQARDVLFAKQVHCHSALFVENELAPSNNAVWLNHYQALVISAPPNGKLVPLI